MSTLNQRPRGRPPTGKALSAAERMRRLRARRKAAGLREVTTWTSEPRAATPYSSRGHEAFGLERLTLSPDGHFPLNLQREDEQRLYQLVRSGDLRPESWRAEGPPFFMAGLAVLLAGSPQFPRRPLLDLADTLHPGILEIAVYNIWLRRTPIEPSRFFSQLRGAT